MKWNLKNSAPKIFFCQQIHQMVIERFYGNQSKRLITWIVCNVQSIFLTALSISFLRWFPGTFHLAKTTGLKLREEFASSFRPKSLLSLSNAKIQRQYPRWMFLFVIQFYAHHYLHVWLKNVRLFPSMWRCFSPLNCLLLIWPSFTERSLLSIEFLDWRGKCSATNKVSYRVNVRGVNFSSNSTLWYHATGVPRKFCRVCETIPTKERPLG